MEYEEITIEPVLVKYAKHISNMNEQFVVSKPRGFIARAYQNPLHDCQTFSIASMYNLLKLPKKQCLYLLHTIRLNQGKRQLLFNIPKDYESYANEVFPQTSIVIKNEYKSTRNSTMILYLVNLDFLRNINFDEFIIKKEEIIKPEILF